MLLCRVVLGRQFVTHEFRCESANDEALIIVLLLLLLLVVVVVVVVVV